MSHRARRTLVVALAAGFLCVLQATLPAVAQERPGAQGNSERGAISMTPGGQRLDKEAVAKLERQLAKNQNDLKIRRQLLSHYSKLRTPSARSARLDHVMWIIANQPAARMAGRPLCQVGRNTDPEGYKRARDLWLEQVGAHSTDAAVIGNAARFMLRTEEQVAEDLLNMCRALDPKNSQWTKLLGSINALREVRERREQEAPDPKVTAFKDIERTYGLTDGKTQKQLLLPELCKTAFEAGDYDKAESYAMQALEAVDDLRRDNLHGEALHHGHVILGRLALMNGQVTSAKQHLLKAGKTPGSPALDSFGPNMSLAKALLEIDEDQAVLAYFETCSEFWKHGETRLAAWTEVVKEGGIPDFGSNLQN